MTATDIARRKKEKISRLYPAFLHGVKKLEKILRSSDRCNEALQNYSLDTRKTTILSCREKGEAMNNTHLVSFRRPVWSSHDRRGGAKKEETRREERIHYSGTP